MTLIRTKINSFIRRLYLYSALENFIVFLFFFGGYFVLYLLIEYLLYLDSTTRTILFFTSLVISVLWILFKVFYPIIQSFVPYFQISHEKASVLIGSSNSDIDDKLLNLLQLENLGNDDLILESISLLEKKLFSFNFSKALNIRNLVLFTKLIMIPIFVLGIFSIINFDAIVASPAKRIISFNNEYKKPLDFNINILNDSLKVVEGEVFSLKFKTDATQPLFVFIGNDIYEAQLIEGLYTINFPKATNSISFRIGYDNLLSYLFNIDMIVRPKVKSISLEYTPPKHTHSSSILETNLSNISVPYGSILKWNIDVFDDEFVDFHTSDTLINFVYKDDYFYHVELADTVFNYSILISNKQLKNFIKFDYKIDVIYDKYPSLRVDVIRSDDYIFGENNFVLFADDDYGILSVGYVFIKNNSEIFRKTIKINNVRDLTKDIIIRSTEFDFSNIIDVKFFVVDNDKLSGYKTTYSPLYNVDLFSDKTLLKMKSEAKDSLLRSYSLELNDKLSNEKFENDFKKLDFKSSEEIKLNKLKEKVETSILEKQLLLKSLELISDDEILKEIEDAISAQNQLLEAIKKALKNTEVDKIQSEDLDNKNQFNENKTLNFLRKVAANELLKQLNNDADKLNIVVDDFDVFDKSGGENLSKDISQFKEKLKEYSKLKGDDKLSNDLENDLNSITNEVEKRSSGDKDSMKKSAQQIKNKLNSNSSTGGSKISIDVAEVEYLFNQYLALSFSEEILINNFDLSSSNNKISQYNLLKILNLLNQRLYNFAVENSFFTRTSFDKIYPLQNVQIRINESYEENDEFKLNQRQRELLSNLNSVTDLLSDILNQMQNADANAESSGEANERKNSTPQDLLDKQKKLNSKKGKNLKKIISRL